jgi:hypothetical protein
MKISAWLYGHDNERTLAYAANNGHVKNCGCAGRLAALGMMRAYNGYGNMIRHLAGQGFPRLYFPFVDYPI